MRITACVATRNRTDMLHQLLWSLIRQEYRDWDLVIVDDSDVPVQWNAVGVYPRLFREITRTSHDLRIVPGPRVRRIGAAYQVGFRSAREENPLFFRVDDDAWLEPDYFAKLLELMKDPLVGACGGLFLHPGHEIECLEPDDARYCHAAIDRLSDHVNIQWHRHKRQEPIPVEHLTANILFSSEWLRKIGGFEPNLYRQHRDETQAGWRLHVEGARLFVHPSAVAWHLRGVQGGARDNAADVYVNDHRTFMAQRKTMKPGIHVSLGHAIGDGFMATPMIRAMKKANPKRNLAVSAPWAKAVLSGNTDVDAVAEHPLDAQRTLRLEQSVYGWASANRWHGHLAEAYCRMFDLPVPQDVTPRFFWDGDRPVPTEIECRQPYIVIAPWSTAKTFDFYQDSGNKNWSIDRWPAVIAWAHRNGFHVVQIRASEQEPLVDGVDVDFCGRQLREAFACIEGASLLVSVDTMAHHAAAAFQVPSVVLWGRSKPVHFGYRQPHIVNIQGDCPGLPVACMGNSRDKYGEAVAGALQERPCIHGDQWAMDQEVCPIPGHPCMAGITAEMVVEAMNRLMKTFSERKSRQEAA
jgi:ADP-heptose:LPS heptosyltransferase